MAKIHKYGIRDFEAQFPNEEACLKALFLAHHSKKCSCGGTYTIVKGRPQYQCSKCRYQIAPKANTIFHKSETPLRLWFMAIFHFSNAKSGYSAKQLERNLNVTYKTAWRMLKLIRESLKQTNEKLDGIVEVDETYYGGRYKSGKNNINHSQSMKKKSVITGAIKRGGTAIIKVAPNARAKTLTGFVHENLKPKTILMTDESNRYHNVKGMERHMVNHSRGEFARNGVFHVNSVESFWSHFKRSTKGTHKSISKKYLQTYLDAFVFHYNNRHNDRDRFSALLGVLLHA